MRIDSAEISFLEIPFRLSVSHGARADRTFSDSLVLAVRAGGCEGFGEAVVRDYVSGGMGEGEDFRGRAASAAARILRTLAGAGTWREALALLASADCEPAQLPILCAVETAVIDLACRAEGVDVYGLLGRKPAREKVAYGGVMPILPLEAARQFIGMYRKVGFPDFKVKVSADRQYNEAILELCRSSLGPQADIRVDANACWSVPGVDGHLEVCGRFGVRVVEQPFPVGAEGAAEAAARARSRGFSFMADEGVVAFSDVGRIAAEGTYHSLNLRLSKNGGLQRLLAMADQAGSLGLPCMLGCMVGETGILSALGRSAACLLPAPLYLEGSYDGILLTENVTRENLGFGPGGVAPVIRDRAVGFDVDKEKLARLTAWRAPCL
jgi:L-Ala-D/L-Glu epimerase